MTSYIIIVLALCMLSISYFHRFSVFKIRVQTIQMLDTCGCVFLKNREQKLNFKSIHLRVDDALNTM